MLNVRSRIFIIASIAVLLILAVVILILVFNKKETEPTTDNTANQNQVEEGNFDNSILTTEPTIVPAGTKVKTQTTEEMERNAVVALAKIFTERYGTYSTHGSYDNLKDAIDLATDSLAAELEKKIPEKNGTATPGEYRGVTVTAIAAEIIDWQKDSATVSVSAIKAETVGVNTTNTNVKAEVNLKKSNDEWLVDGFAWK